MLILTRRTGETVMIGNEVTLTVLGVKGNQVRIGINAPKNVPRPSRRDLRAHQTRAVRWRGERQRSGLAAGAAQKGGVRAVTRACRKRRRRLFAR